MTTPVGREDSLEALRELSDAATPGPYVFNGYPFTLDGPDAEFAIAAANYVRAALAATPSTAIGARDGQPATASIDVAWAEAEKALPEGGTMDLVLENHADGGRYLAWTTADVTGATCWTCGQPCGHYPGQEFEDVVAHEAALVVAATLRAATATPSTAPTPSDADTPLTTRSSELVRLAEELDRHADWRVEGGRVAVACMVSVSEALRRLAAATLDATRAAPLTALSKLYADAARDMGTEDGEVVLLSEVSVRAALAQPDDFDPDNWPVVDPDYMCPNCVTPWKCNGPHLDDQTPAVLAEQAMTQRGLERKRVARLARQKGRTVE